MPYKLFFAVFFLLNFMGFRVVAQMGTVSGIVKGPAGVPVIGASVLIQELSLGVATDVSGRFTLRGIPSGTYQLSVSSIGYESATTSITLDNNMSILSLSLSLEESELVLDGLVVTSQKRSQTIIDVPIAIASVDGSILSEFNIRQADAFSELIPGLQVQLQSPNNPGWVIRGITSDDGDSRVEPRVSVFQDGVSISKSRGSVVEIFDVERVEVLKGPQGTLFGRGAQIGAVHFIQNKAQPVFSGEFTGGYGNFNQRLATGYVNLPVAKDKLFLRVSGIYNAYDGFIQNEAGDDLNGKDALAIRTSLRYLPGPRTVVDLIVNYQRDNYPGTAFVSGTIAPPGQPPQSPYGPVSVGHNDKELFINRKVFGSTLLIDHDFRGDWSLSSITAIRKFDSYESFDADGSLAPSLWFAEDAVGKQFSQEFRFNYNPSGSFNGFAGLNFFHEQGSQRVPYESDERSTYALLSPLLNQFVPLLPVIPVLNPDGSPNLSANENPQMQAIQAALGLPPFKTFHSEAYENLGQVNAAEIFADGTWNITPGFSLTMGIRGTLENVENGYQAFFEGVPSPLGFLINDVIGAAPNILFLPTDQRRTAGGVFRSWVGRAVASQRINDRLSAYASVSKGRRPNVIQITATEVNNLSDETVYSYEAGIKGLSLSNRLQFDLAGYFYDYRNFQVTIIEVIDGTLIPNVKDAGDASAKGLETSIRYAANRNISLFANYAWIDAKISDTDRDGNEQELAGNRFRLTPEHSFAVGFNATLPVGAGYFFLRPSYTYKSSVFFEEENQPGIKQDGYGLLNARLGYNLEKTNTELALYGSNLLDEQYLIDAGNTGLNFGTPTFIAGPPRFFGVQITQRF